MRRLFLYILLAAPFVLATPAMQVSDADRWHVHPAGRPLSVLVTADAPLQAHWLDARGNPLDRPVALPYGASRLLTAPRQGPGYLQLAIRAGDGPPRLFGFVLTEAGPAPTTPDPLSPFGRVHAEPADPWLAGWTKTTTWTTFAPQAWDGALRALAARGHLELPLVTGADWDSDDTRPIDRAQLARLQDRFRALLRAHRPPLTWELGLEENLEPRFRAPYYWPNLAAKVRALRAVADAEAPGTRFAYQVAGLAPGDVQAFLLSPAAPLFDILSLHPYPWPDFPDPDTWLDDYLRQVRQLLRWYPRGPQRLWITELGAPNLGLQPHPTLRTAAGEPAHGLDRSAAADFLVKAHAIAFRHGVEKLFWYHERDRNGRSSNPEDHFGLRDAAGFPKPAYAALLTLQRALAGQVFWREGRRGAARWLEFVARDGRRTIIAWAEGERPVTLPSALLLADGGDPATAQLLDAVGTPQPLGATLRLDRHPVFLLTRWGEPAPARRPTPTP